MFPDVCLFLSHFTFEQRISLSSLIPANRSLLRVTIIESQAQNRLRHDQGRERYAHAAASLRVVSSRKIVSYLRSPRPLKGSRGKDFLRTRAVRRSRFFFLFLVSPGRRSMEILRPCVLFNLCMLVASQRTALDSPASLYIYRKLRRWITDNFGAPEEGRLFTERRRQKVQNEIPASVPFPCNVTAGRSPKVPNSVHRLRPGDIDVIAAMGDSLTAGAGVLATDNLIEIAVENRGLAASIGGQGNWRTALTLPNILKEFNPGLFGYSTGDSLTSQPDSQLNVAESGAISRDMPFMAEYLVNRIKNDPRVDQRRHWKLISLMIGSNDFCSNMCTLPSAWTILKNHREDLLKTLRILRDNLSRTFVALHLPPHLRTIVNTRDGRRSLQCYVMTTMECPCLFAMQYRAQREEYYNVMTSWQDLEAEIADYAEFHRDDFTVVALPTLRHAPIPPAEDGFADMSYLSTDCFHVSQKANAMYANGIWNNLLQPYGNKTDTWPVPLQTFLCPTAERPFLGTRENA